MLYANALLVVNVVDATPATVVTCIAAPFTGAALNVNVVPDTV